MTNSILESEKYIFFCFVMVSLSLFNFLLYLCCCLDKELNVKDKTIHTRKKYGEYLTPL